MIRKKIFLHLFLLATCPGFSAKNTSEEEKLSQEFQELTIEDQEKQLVRETFEKLCSGTVSEEDALKINDVTCEHSDQYLSALVIEYAVQKLDDVNKHFMKFLTIIKSHPYFEEVCEREQSLLSRNIKVTQERSNQNVGASDELNDNLSSNNSSFEEIFKQLHKEPEEGDEEREGLKIGGAFKHNSGEAFLEYIERNPAPLVPQEKKINSLKNTKENPSFNLVENLPYTIPTTENYYTQEYKTQEYEQFEVEPENLENDDLELLLLITQTLKAPEKKDILEEIENFFLREGTACLKTKEIFENREFSFWHKDQENMLQTMSWDTFNELKKLVLCLQSLQNKKNTFLDYTFENKTFTQIPGFAGGTCLWSHLGIHPTHMVDILFECAKDLKESDISNNAHYIAELMDALDPCGKIAPSVEDYAHRLELFISSKDSIKENWIKKVNEHGGKEITLPNESIIAFRPPNGDYFFQQVANTLQTNIFIFSCDENSYGIKLNLTRNFLSSNPSQCTLYLLQDSMGHGTHYDLLVEKNKSVSYPIVREMKDYLDSNNK